MTTAFIVVGADIFEQTALCMKSVFVLVAGEGSEHGMHRESR